MPRETLDALARTKICNPNTPKAKRDESDARWASRGGGERDLR